jgi:D-alanyl-D-alanine carboxypeptidase
MLNKNDCKRYSMLKYIYPFLIFVYLSFFADALMPSVILNGETGEVYQSSLADKEHAPASLTKMMTLYILFQELERGKFNLHQSLRISKKAARQPPTKLGLKAGRNISVKNAILGLIIKSANDAAMVVAEAIAGSEEKFANRMTRVARSLGMSHTVFKNPSGLPNAAQKTTARDLAKLALAVTHHYPKFAALFKTRSFKYNGKNYINHNKLLRTFSGCTGLKTGYTNASGYNLAASAERKGVKLIGIVLGGRSSNQRNVQMAKLLETAFKRKQRVMVAKKVAHPERLRSRPHLNMPNANALIQVGAYSTRAKALSAAKQASNLAPEWLKPVNIYIEPVSSNGRTLFRSRIRKVEGHNVKKICSILTTNNLPCVDVTN